MNGCCHRRRGCPKNYGINFVDGYLVFEHVVQSLPKPGKPKKAWSTPPELKEARILHYIKQAELDLPLDYIPA
jgi:hypothetical protein